MTAVAEGEVVINCTITCADGVANIGLVLNVTNTLDEDETID